MSQKIDGGPAFSAYDPVEDIHHPGMSLRDYFACAAMQGLIATEVNHQNMRGEAQIAELAYKQADKMLAERNSP